MNSNFSLNHRSVFWLLVAASIFAFSLAGCGEPESGFEVTEDEITNREVKPKPLSLLAIDFPKFDQEIVRQWSAQRDGDLKITHVTAQQWEDGKFDVGKYDLVVHPQAINFDLISGKQIRPLSKKIADNEDLNRSAFLAHFRKAMVRHADETWGVSLGDHPLRLFYRKDLIADAGIDPPETWDELNSAFDVLSQADSTDGMKLLALPGTDTWSTKIFLARVASLIRGRGKLTTFFDRKTMKPTITALPFVEALKNTRELYQRSDTDLTVAEAYESFVAGKSVFAIGWPTLPDDSPLSDSDMETASANWGVMRLPGSGASYDLGDSRWVERGSDSDVHVDLLGIGGYNISVAASTSKSNDAIEFIVWLTDKKNSQQLLAEIAAPFRATHLANLDRWYALDQVDRDFSDQFADTIAESHRANIFLMFPQVRGSQKYMRVLENGVRDYFDGKDDAETMLQSVAEEWEALSENYGRNRQVNALRKGNDI